LPCAAIETEAGIRKESVSPLRSCISYHLGLTQRLA